MKGFLDQFERCSRYNMDLFVQAKEQGYFIVGVEPSMVSFFRKDYGDVFYEQGLDKTVLLIQELLDKSDIVIKTENQNKEPYYLLNHCMELSMEGDMDKIWERVFKKMGLSLELIKSGCCGMAGIFGMETRHEHLSTTIYKDHYQKVFCGKDLSRVLATGFSCRSQIKYFEKIDVKHPVDVLLTYLNST